MFDYIAEVQSKMFNKAVLISWQHNLCGALSDKFAAAVLPELRPPCILSADATALYLSLRAFLRGLVVGMVLRLAKNLHNSY